MKSVQLDELPTLYDSDETAWLERMAELARTGHADRLDLGNLAEYLADMAKRDKREVESRLAVLIAHLLKWLAQPERRTGSWRATVEVQRHELELLLQSGTLYNHAEGTLPAAYIAAVRQAAAETGLATSAFPTDCPYSVDELLHSVDELLRLDQLPE